MCNIKKCTTCKVEKELQYFPKNKKGKFGVHTKCKKCFKKYREVNKQEKTSVNKKKCKKCNATKAIEEFQTRSNFKDGYDCSCTECRRNVKVFNTRKCCTCNTSYKTDSYKSSKERIRKCSNCKKQRNNKYRKEYINKNKEKWAVRNIVSQSFIRALKGQYSKSEKTEELLGCTLQQAILYIESTFQEGMSWKNHGRCKDGDCSNVWHIDHKIPLASAKNEKELVKLCHYTNLQALWAEDNLSKSSFIFK